MIQACGNLESMYVFCYEIALFDSVFFFHAPFFFVQGKVLIHARHILQMTFL